MDDINKLSQSYPREATYVFETLTLRESITPDEIKLALSGKVEGERAPLIIRTLMLIKNALYELQGKKLYDPVPVNYAPKRLPDANSNDPIYNMRYAYQQKKMVESKRDKKEKEMAKKVGGFWR
jgi:hypothetical protein